MRQAGGRKQGQGCTALGGVKQLHGWAGQGTANGGVLSGPGDAMPHEDTGREQMRPGFKDVLLACSYAVHANPLLLL